MQHQFVDKTATHYSATHPGVMTCSFLIISGLLGFLFHRYQDASIEPWQALFVCLLFDIGTVFYALKWMHTIRFTQEGLIFCRLGYEYRKIRWDQVIQVGVAKEYKASRLTLVLTPENIPLYDSSYSTTTIYVEKYRRKLILLDATKDNLATVRQLYGEFDYEARSH